MFTSLFLWGATDALFSNVIATIGMTGIILIVGGIKLRLSPGFACGSSRTTASGSWRSSGP